jgi:choline dehydrogenase-like flavoprotein
MAPEQFDAVVIGTGFGGAVTACRLVEAGFDICVLERGRRYGPDDFPRYAGEDLFAQEDSAQTQQEPPPDFSRWLWERDHGIYDIVDLGEAVAVQAAGYGGGSLIYANVHLRPPLDVFDHGWPVQYAGSALTPYFDLAAYMLGATPIPVRLAKTMQLMHAAKALPSRSAPGAFRVPLAVSFDPGRSATASPDSDWFDNAFGRRQRHCDMRGRCWLGCDRRAKNTLDLNYLARAEDDESHPADVRTLAEVTMIERCQDGTFRVTYNDLLTRDPDDTHAIAARFVFLCAGAIGTTRLLFSNPTLLEGLPSARGPLGSRYFTNSGSLAAVFDCEQPHEADYGPTITAALLYDREIPDTHTLDFRQHHTSIAAAPGVGAEIVGTESTARAVLVRDPLLDWGAWADGTATGCLVVNRPSVPFRDGEPILIGSARGVAQSSSRALRHWFVIQDGGYPPDVEPLTGVFRSPLWARRNRFREAAGVLPFYRPLGRQLRVQAFADAMTGIPTGDLLDTQIRLLLPRWFSAAIDETREELVTGAGAAFLPLLNRLLDELSVTVADQFDPDLLARLGLTFISGVKKEMLVRGMLRQGLQVLAGSEVTLAARAAEVFTSGLPLEPEQLLQAAGQVGLWALAYGSAGRHTAVMLTLGRDLQRGRLDPVASNGARAGALTARLPGGAARESAQQQERVLRAIARDGWKGELRTNPAWAALDTYLTVHSQGGCPMGTSPSVSVTDPWGEVYGCSGLFVMDAAAFPTSVGVNPSATIAAVAERKIERFIRRHRGREWQARDMANAVAWAYARRDAIDPLRQLRVFSHEPAAERLGLFFKERMRGFSEKVADAPADWTQLEADPAGPGWKAFPRAEEEGMRQGRTAFARLRVCTADLAELVTSAHTTHPVRMAVTGRVDLRNRRAGTLRRLRTTDSARSYVQFFAAPPAAPGVPAPPAAAQARYFRYELELTDGMRRYLLHGRKVLSNDRGTDVWSDTATLYFELAGPDTHERGVLRLSLPDFARLQLPSMTVTGTTDPARRSWALLAFYKYFGSGLSDVYAARADRLVELLLKSVTTIHV